MKKKVQRICVGCSAKKDKNELIRIVKQKDEIIRVDKTGKLPGRGAYICGEVDCFNKIKRTHKLENALETKISEHVYEEIRGVMIEQGK